MRSVFEFRNQASSDRAFSWNILCIVEYIIHGLVEGIRFYWMLREIKLIELWLLSLNNFRFLPYTVKFHNSSQKIVIFEQLLQFQVKIHPIVRSYDHFALNTVSDAR